jgi:predicted amino acid dehydrogenase
LAAELGANVAALGGFTSIYGENGIRSASGEAGIAVTTGNTLTAAMAVRGIRRAAEALRMELKRATVAIIGATGDIGAACARALASHVRSINLAARSRPRLQALARVLDALGLRSGRIAAENRDAVHDADIVLCVASAAAPIVGGDDFRPGSIVCDVGYPKNVAAQAAHRRDVFVFDGGLVSTPSPIDFGFDNGLPSPDVLYGCFAEGVVLALEERFESFSQGKGNITPEKMDEIAELSEKHGFGLAPFYSGGRLVDDDELDDLSRRFPRQA